MEVSEDIKLKISRIINCFEVGKPDLDISSQFKYHDGPNSILQLTIGSGVTEFGNMRSLVKLYLTKVKDPVLSEYVEKIGEKQLVNDSRFTNAIKEASKTKEWKESFEIIWEEKYFKPALAWANRNNVSTPLGFAVIWDSMVHSGSVPMFLREKFPQRAPFKTKKMEQEWMQAYITVRRRWLANHSRSILHSTVYRMDCFQEIINKNDWDLKLPVLANNVIVK